jgi:hypothetical protein
LGPQSLGRHAHGSIEQLLQGLSLKGKHAEFGQYLLLPQA